MLIKDIEQENTQRTISSVMDLLKCLKYHGNIDTYNCLSLDNINISNGQFIARVYMNNSLSIRFISKKSISKRSGVLGTSGLLNLWYSTYKLTIDSNLI